MNPAGISSEAVSLQRGRHGGPPGQPSNGVRRAVPPRDHIVWSICSFAYLNPLGLGLAALIFSIRARDRKMVGDLDGARRHGSCARCLNICATVLSSIVIIILISVFTVLSNAGIISTACVYSRCK